MAGLILIGGGGHCKSAIDVVEATTKYSITGVVEQASSSITQILGYPVIGTDDDLKALREQAPYALITIGQIKSHEPRARAFAAAKQAGFDCPFICSPKAQISSHAVLGDGTLVMHGVVVNASARVGDNCILNSLSLVEHDAQIGAHSHISTGARVNGGAIIGDACFIGSGAIIRNNITVGEGSVIGAGCVIMQDLPPKSLVRHSL